MQNDSAWGKVECGQLCNFNGKKFNIATGTSFCGGRMTKVAGRVASCAPIMGGVAVALAMLSSSAHATDECGAEAAGADIVTCQPGNYAGGGTYPDFPNGIEYRSADGVTIVIDDPALTVSDGGILVAINRGGSGNPEVRLVNFDTISGQVYAQARVDGDATVVMESGTINASVNERGIYARTVGLGQSPTALLRGGTINISTPNSAGFGGQTGAVQAWAWSSSDVGDVLVGMEAGEVNVFSDAGGLMAVNTRGLTRTIGTTGIRMEGGTVNATGTRSNGAYIYSRYGLSYLDMSDGEINATGVDARGIFARVTGDALGASGLSADAIYRVRLSGGSITGGSGLGSAIHTMAPTGGIIEIGSGVIVNGSASGIAIRDGDLDRDGVDEIGGNAVVTTAGTVTGDAILGLGDDVFNLTGGELTGDIHGDGIAATANDGDDAFNWTGGNWNSSFFGGNGSDAATISAPSYDGTHHVLDGGDDHAVADGWVDRLTFDNITADANGTNITNWEVVTIDGGRIAIVDGALQVGADPATGLTITNGGVMDAGTTFALTGNMTTSANGTFEAFGAGSGVYSISGSVTNNGRITTQDGFAGDSIDVAGDYSGTGSLLLDADLATVRADLLVVGGDVTGGPTSIGISDVSSGFATGNDIMLIDVAGTSVDGDFTFTNGPFVNGAYQYDLGRSGTDWYLQASQSPSLPAYEAIGQLLQASNGLPTLRQRLGDRFWSGAGASADCDLEANGYAYVDSKMKWDTDGLDCLINQQDGLWARIDASRGRHEPEVSSTGSAFDLNRWKMQAGIDRQLGHSSERSLIGGFSAHYGSNSADAESTVGDGSVVADAFGIGGNLTWYGMDGVYADAQGQVSWYDIEASSDAHGKLGDDVSGFGHAFSLEVGKRTPFDDEWTVTPQVQLTYSDVDFDTFTGPNAETVSLSDAASLRGRLGFSVDQERSWQDDGGAVRSHVYGVANLTYEFLDGATVNVSGAALTSRPERLWVSGGVGGSYSWNDDAYSLYGEVLAETSLGNVGDSYSLTGNVGFRIRF